jgi:hypothetical protein
VDRLLVSPASIARIVATYSADLAAFVVKRQKYLLYGRACGPTARVEGELAAP